MAEASPAPPYTVTPTQQILFHVRVIDSWAPCLTHGEPVPRLVWSFFGLELALHGRRQDQSDEEAKEALDFTPTTRAQKRDKLRGLVGPFTVVVQSKMPLEVATDPQKSLLQLLVPVQPHNTLARINKIHFLKHCVTGADVFDQLERVLDCVSVAKPFELTFLRHNHAQAAAKIRPFAARADVQQAQIAQFLKLQADEAKWPDERKRRKQLVLQQMDFHREHYLYDHIGAQLQALHEEIMGSGQWHAYEFERALWYYHAPSGDLYAEHPMRTNEKTRQLIGGVQLRTRMAAKRLQHGTRQFLRVHRVVHQVVQRLADVLGGELVESAFDAAWDARVAGMLVDQLNANATPHKAWSKWRQRATISSEPSAADPAVHVAARAEGRSDQGKEQKEVDPSDTVSTAATPETNLTITACATPRDGADSKVPITTGRRELVSTSEHPTIPRDGAMEVDGHDDDDDGDGVDDVVNWRSRLRLLKQHQEARRRSPKRAKPRGGPHHHSSVVAPRPLAGPLLLDRSSLPFDLSFDTPMTHTTASLREDRRVPAVLLDDHDLAASPWRRDGSFHTFHAFFNSSSSSSPSPSSVSPSGPARLPFANVYPHRSDKYATVPTSKLPIARRATHSMAASPLTVYTHSYAPRTDALASGSVAAKLASSPPKKLPYIRRRNPRNP